jgi:hypothetical protein
VKKTLLIAIISILCFACSEDDPLELGIKTLEVSLYPEEEVAIDAISDFDITYLSTNPYFVDVSAEGMLTANKVGKTLVEVSSHERLLEVSVNVMGRYNVYPDPITDWSMSQSELIAISGEPTNPLSVGFIDYDDYSDKAPSVIYLFSEEDSLVNALVNVLSIYSDDLIKHLDERFVLISDKDWLRVYGNAQQDEDITMLIGFANFGGNYIMVSYVEYEYSETESAKAVATDFKNMRNQMKLFVNEKMNK